MILSTNTTQRIFVGRGNLAPTTNYAKIMATKTRPNILLITSDQQHWNTLGCLNPEIQTPHLDALAQQGTLFNRAYCPNPTCTPTRASIITGKVPESAWCLVLGDKTL